MARWPQALRADHGSEIAEVAVILPIVIALLFAILWFGRAYNIYSTIAYAAREGAKVAVSQSCATCLGPPPTSLDVANRVNQILQASNIDTTRKGAFVPNPIPSRGSCSGAASGLRRRCD